MVATLAGRGRERRTGGGRIAGIPWPAIHNYHSRLAAFREAIQALVRTQEIEKRQKLTVPWEYMVWRECQDNGTLPLSGGLLNQPHILLRCFRIIETEIVLWKQELKQLNEINRRLREQHNAVPNPQ